MDVLVYGIIKDSSGKPYKGAIVKFALNKSFSRDGIYHHNNERRAVTNKYGIFEITLPPSTLDKEGENYYVMTVIYDNVTSSNVIVPDTSPEINFTDLERYKFPFERDEFIGDCHIL